MLRSLFRSRAMALVLSLGLAFTPSVMNPAVLYAQDAGDSGGDAAPSGDAAAPSGGDASYAAAPTPSGDTGGGIGSDYVASQIMDGPPADAAPIAAYSPTSSGDAAAPAPAPSGDSAVAPTPPAPAQSSGDAAFAATPSAPAQSSGDA